MTTTKFKPAPETEVELSPNRRVLAALNKDRAEAAAEVESLRGRTNKLAKLKESVAALESELRQTLAADGKQLAEWAMSDGDAPAPQPDGKKRTALEAKLADARSQALAADAATASVEHVLNTASARYADLERQVPALIANVLIDEARSLLPEVVEATAALAKVRGRYGSLRKFLLERAEAAKDVAMRSGFFADLEALDRESADAGSIGPLLTFDPGAEWQDLARELGDVPHRPTPTLPTAFPGMPVADQWINS